MEIIYTKELSKYLKINEKKIYKLVQESKIPHIKIGGKIAFTREIVNKWILENTEREKNIYIAGSDDVLLRRIIDIYNKSGNVIAYYAPIGSINGLKALKENRATISCVHILDLEKKDYTLSYLDKYLNRDDYVVISLFERTQGIYTKKGNPCGINSIKDIAIKGARFVNRNFGSGTRLLFDFLLNEAGINSTSINGYAIEVESHLHAGIEVLKDTADAAFGIQHIAYILDLDFIPLWNERFEFVVTKEHYYSSHVRAFLSFFEPPSLVKHVKDLTGYNITKTGNVVYLKE
ncbi:MAG TPA: helix-turn-helix transcriptional regulator [Syntrophorhabdaceae bacterium]|nr:helix-turn-helix transcriptional regulator [Syntrophorhabdaceae bacterium]